jgi:hypothetical protein
MKIFNAFQILNKKKIVIEEEFRLNKREVDITIINQKHFAEAVYAKDYFIYDVDKEVLFAIDWDDFFFLICSNGKNVETIVNTLDFDGFYCNDRTEAAWEFTREEIEIGLQKEKLQVETQKAATFSKKKPWWKIW